MGGRIHGFLGGVLLASSLTYLTALEFQKNQQTISKSLLSSKAVLDNRNQPEKPYVLGSNTLNYNDRSSIKETFADIWNQEIIKGIQWVYSINWLAAGEKLEKGVSKLSSSTTNN